jgi:hypothetical protein
MAFLRMKSNKKFEYTPRYYKGKQSPYKIEHRFDEFRSTAHQTRGLKNKVIWALEDLSDRQSSQKSTRRVLIIAAVLFFIFFWIMGFDLGVFFASHG